MALLACCLEASSAQVTVLSNSWEAPGFSAAVLLDQPVSGTTADCNSSTTPVGAIPGQVTLGNPETWRLFVFTNDTPFTNALFALFNPRGTEGTSTDPDLDLYLSRSPALLELVPAAVTESEKSFRRGGVEWILSSNATSGEYYLAVKPESAGDWTFSVAAIFCELPFVESTDEGDLLLRTFPLDVAIPDSGSELRPLTLLTATDADIFVRRLVVSNALSHTRVADLVSTLAHDGQTATLLKHTPTELQSLVFDDTAERVIAGALPSAGPGSLQDFAGRSGAGLWWLSMLDAVAGVSGTNVNLGLYLERQADLRAGTSVRLEPEATRNEWIELPADATNLTVRAVLESGSGPVQVRVSGLNGAKDDSVCAILSGSAELVLVYNTTWDPPLNPGINVVEMRNISGQPVTLRLIAEVMSDPNYRPAFVLTTAQPQLLLTDGGTTVATMQVTNAGRIAGLVPGVRIDHPRLSDLSLRLISPKGTAVLLSQNRGLCSTNGMGRDILVTNVTPVSSSGGPEASTNVLDTGRASGEVRIDYNMYALPDSLRVYYEGERLLDSGLVSQAGSWVIAYGPGASSSLTIVMNEGGNYDPDTAWDYVVTSTRPGWLPSLFAEDPGLLPIKFAPPPFTNQVSVPGLPRLPDFAPEESLHVFNGEPLAGEWRLEITDAEPGPATGPARLLGWELEFQLQKTVPDPIELAHNQAQTNWVGPGQTRYFRISSPAWAKYATNTLIHSAAPVDLWFIAPGPPDGTEVPLVVASHADSAAFTLTQGPSEPGLIPGEPYFLGVHNTNSQRVSFALNVAYDVAPLPQDAVLPIELPFGMRQYFEVTVATNAFEASFHLFNLTGDGSLVLRRGLPFPDESSYDAASFNAGNADEFLKLGPTASNVRIAAGVWYVAVLNSGDAALQGSLRFQQRFFNAASLQIVCWETEGTDLCVTWNSQPGREYQLLGRENLDAETWAPIGGPSSAVEIWATQCVPLDSGYRFFKVQDAGPTPGP